MEKEEIELFKISMLKDIPDNPRTRQVIVDNKASTPTNAFDICMIATTIIDIYIRRVPEKFQNEEEAYIMKTLPVLIMERHKITDKI